MNFVHRNGLTWVGPEPERAIEKRHDVFWTVKEQPIWLVVDFAKVEANGTAGFLFAYQDHRINGFSPYEGILDVINRILEDPEAFMMESTL